MNTELDPTPNDDPVLRETLKRCSPATYYAACKFRATGDPEALRTVVTGVIERFVERESRARLAGPAESLPTLRLREDLGLDSLTMMEVILVAEEVMRVSISNEELTRLHTLGEVHAFIGSKLSAPAAAADGASPPATPLLPPNLALGMAGIPPPREATPA